MAYEILIESEDEKHAPPSRPLLRLSYTGPGNGYHGLVHIDIGMVKETNVARTFTPDSSVTVKATEFFQALVGLGPVTTLVTGTGGSNETSTSP